MWYFMPANRSGINFHSMAVDRPDNRAELGENTKGGSNVCNIRYIFNTAYAVGKYRRRKNGNDRILGAANFHFANKAVAAGYENFIQIGPLP